MACDGGRMNITEELVVRAIDPAHLGDVRRRGVDGHGNRLAAFAATGQGEPLRCCLRYASRGEEFTLISYAPFDHPSVWTEVGPVYIHAARCDGYVPSGGLLERLSAGPRLLHTYRADDTMNYDHNTVVVDEIDLEPVIGRLLSEPDVATVHVRNLRLEVLHVLRVGGGRPERPWGQRMTTATSDSCGARALLTPHAEGNRRARDTG